MKLGGVERNVLIVLTITCIGSLSDANNAPFTPLAQILSQALSNSDSLHAQKDAEKVSEARLDVAQTAYYPQISAEALDSTGFAGSTSALGVTGLMGSPFRSGYSFGLVATQQIYDFGKTSSKMNVAKKSLETQKSRTGIERWNVEQQAIDLYYGCSRAQTQAVLWAQVEEDSRSVQKEVDRYVSTGQRSVVDGLLAKAQSEESARDKSAFLEELNVLLDRLALLVGMPAKEITCPNLMKVGPTTLKAAGTYRTQKNPYILQAQAAREEAEAQVREARSGYMPKLLAMGSFGDMQNARLVDKLDYSAGIGLVFPLFDGLQTPREVQEAHALQTQKESEVGAVHQYVDDANLKLDQKIRADQVAIDHLHQELADSDKALRIARQRYLSFSGSLVDVREAIRNFSHLRSDYIDLQTDWQRATSLKAAFNGEEF